PQDVPPPYAILPSAPAPTSVRVPVEAPAVIGTGEGMPKLATASEQPLVPPPAPLVPRAAGPALPPPPAPPSAPRAMPAVAPASAAPAGAPAVAPAVAAPVALEPGAPAVAPAAAPAALEPEPVAAKVVAVESSEVNSWWFEGDDLIVVSAPGPDAPK